MNLENNNNQNNNVLWLSFGAVGGAFIVYWLMKDRLDKKEQELNQTNREKELKKIQEQVQELEKQLVKLNEEQSKKNNHSNQGSNLWSSSLINCLSQWFKKKLI